MKNKEVDIKRARSALGEFILTNIAQKKARAEAGKKNLGACVLTAHVERYGCGLIYSNLLLSSEPFFWVISYGY